MDRRVLSVMLVLCLLLAGCEKKTAEIKDEQPGTAPVSSQEKPEIPDVSTESAPETTAVSTASYDDSLLDDYVLEGNFPGENSEQAYVFHIPVICVDTEDAAEFNSQVEQYRKGVRDGEEIPYRRITWESYWNGSLLSLVTEYTDRDTDDVSYSTFNYDFALDRKISNDELIERAGTDRDHYREALRKSASAAAEHTMITCAEGNVPPDRMRELMDLYARTMNPENLDDSRTQIFMDEEGKLCTIFLAAVPAGGGWYPVFLTPDFSAGNVTRTAECEFISGELRENQVLVTFHHRGPAKIFLENTDAEFEHPYRVEGLYGNYREMAVGFMGNGGDAYLFLADDQGLVTCCNLFAGLQDGTGKLTASGPLPVPQNVQGFETSHDEDGYSVAAVLQNGEKADLYEYLCAAENG